MRIGLVGVGRIGAFHADTLRQLDEVESLVLADADSARAQQVADKLGVRAAPSTEALLAAAVDGPGRLDGLVVVAPTAAHPALILAAVEAGLPVFCEKPGAPDLGGTLAVVDAVSRRDVPVQIGFQRRFDAGYTAAREAVAAGRLGWLHTLRAGTLDPAPPPPEYVAASGGVFRDMLVHDFDIIRWVTGREVVEVYGVGANRGAGFFAAVGDVDTAATLLTLDDGTLALVSGTRYNAAGYDVRLEVLGCDDSVSVGLDDRLPLRSTESGVAFPSGVAYPNFMERFRSAYARELAAFLDVVAARASSPCTVYDALAAFRIAEACERSRREHRPVRVAEAGP
jgi:myo-inositol 2-dehydrogenase/D-chiro-inositol 1-dehydrogenase